jgi:RNA polymerase sigma-70 factor (ECF subfamily)
LEISDKKIQLNILKAKEGSQVAFRFLLDTFWGAVYNYQLKRTKSENDAEDIAIQTFSKAFDKILTFDETYVFKTWLIAISKNVHIDLLRKKKTSIFTETIAKPSKEDSSTRRSALPTVRPYPGSKGLNSN